MDCSTPGFPVLHQLPEVAQTHVHQVKLMSIESRGELGSPNTEGAASIAYGEKIQLSIGPSLVVQWKEWALEERTGPDYLGPGQVDHGEAKNLSTPEPELFLFLGGIRPSDRAGQDDVLV